MDLAGGQRWIKEGKSIQSHSVLLYNCLCPMIQKWLPHFKPKPALLLKEQEYCSQITNKWLHPAVCIVHVSKPRYILPPTNPIWNQYEEILQMLSLIFLESLLLECSRSLKRYNYHPCKLHHQRKPFVNVTAWKWSRKVIILSSKYWKPHSLIFHMPYELILFSDYKRKPALLFIYWLYF